jgi:selenide,water dikinase
MKRLLLLGGGHAHVHVLRSLARSALTDAQVMLVSPTPQVVYSGMVPGWVAGHYALDECLIPLASLARAARVSYVAGSAVALDADACTVQLADGRVAEYDLLSIDTGSSPPPDIIPGAAEHAMLVRPMEALVPQLQTLFDRPRPIDVVVVGGGAGGVELAMALMYRLAGKGDRRQARVTLVSGAATPLEGFPAGTLRRALRAMKRLHITVLPETCIEIQPGHVVLSHGARVACDAAVLALGAHAPHWLRDSGLALDERGFIAIGATLQSLSHRQVFAAGDVASRFDAPHPKSGVYAVRAGPPLTRNLRRALAGTALRGYTPPERTLNLLSCGSKRAIASWGQWSVQGRWVWWWKDHIDRAFVSLYRRCAATAAPADQSANPA